MSLNEFLRMYYYIRRNQRKIYFVWIGVISQKYTTYLKKICSLHIFTTICFIWGIMQSAFSNILDMSLIISLPSGLSGFLIECVCICVVLSSCRMNFDDLIAYICLNIEKFYCLYWGFNFSVICKLYTRFYSTGTLIIHVKYL